MDILKKVTNISSSVRAFEKHPARELDLEQKIHYLNGLALVMNVDENIDEKEKEYLKILLNSFNLPVEQLDELIAFSQNPDDEAIQEMLKVLGEASDIKYVFLLDCLMLAHYDGELHENEKKLIESYFELFKLSLHEKEQIYYLYDKIIKRDQKALSRLFQQKDTFKRSLFTYLLDYYGLNVENITEANVSKKDKSGERKKKIKRINDAEEPIKVSSSQNTKKSVFQWLTGL